jgi:predicted RNase H-like HicB family nuclease
MKHLQQVVKALITDGEESVFVGTCFNLSVVTQGNTLDEVVQNL